MPPLKPNATVPVPAPTEPFRDRAAFCAFDRGKHVVARDVTAANVVEIAVVCFCYERID